MTGARRGFTMAELMVVIVITGIVLGLVAPRFTAMRERNSLNSAKQKVAASLSAARAAAIQSGRPATFTRTNSEITVTVRQADGINRTVVEPVALDRMLLVTLTSPTSTNTVVFDPRGLVSNLDATARFVVERGGLRDSVCVSRFGVIMPTGCQL